MPAVVNSPMDRVKMLNLREDALLRRHLEEISTLEKKQLHTLNKDTINLRMELRAHRFRAMKTSVRQKGALQEFDDRWRQRKAAQVRQARLEEVTELDESEHETTKRHQPAHQRLFQSAGAGHRVPPPEIPRSASSLSATRANLTNLNEVRGQGSPEVRVQGHRRSRTSSSSLSETSSSHRSSPRISESRSPAIPENRSFSRSNSTISSSGTSKSMFSAIPRPPTTPRSSGSRRGSTYRRQSVVRPRTTHPAGKDYMERLVQSIAGGPKGRKVAGERGGKGPEALLAKLGDVRFDEYTDGSLAMEIRNLNRKKSVAHGSLLPPTPSSLKALPTATPPSQAPPLRPAPPPGPAPRGHTAPPTGRRRKHLTAVLAAGTWQPPPVVKGAWSRGGRGQRGGRGYDSDKGVADENEGLLRLHREGQRQEYEDVLRRVKAFLGKPTRGPLLPRARLTAEDAILLNKVRPPRTRLKGAVKLVMFLNKAGGLKAAAEGNDAGDTGSGSNNTQGGSTGNPLKSLLGAVRKLAVK